MSEVVLPGAASQGAVVEQSRAIAEVAAAVQVAQQFPRDLGQVERELRQITSRLATANKAFYQVPNRGAGMSVHIARELGRVWRNVDYGVRELARDDDAGVSEMQAWAWDQESNVRSTRSFIQPHEKSLQGGRRKALTDLNDIYLNNQNTGAKAVRECIFSILPGWLVADAEAQLRSTLEHGEGKPIEERRAEAVQAFAAHRVTVSQLEAFARKPVGSWGATEIAELIRVYSSISTDGISAREFFPEQPVQMVEAPSE